MGGWRLISEVKPDGRPDGLGFPTRPHVELNKKIRSLLERPGQTLRRFVSQASGKPVQHVAGGRPGGLGKRDPREAWSRIAFVPLARHGSGIETHYGVVHALGPWPEFQSSDVSGCLQRR